MSLTALARLPPCLRLPKAASCLPRPPITLVSHSTSLSSQPSSTLLALVCLLRASPDIFVHEDRQLLMGSPDSPPSLDAYFHLQSGLSAFGMPPAIRTDTFLTANHGSRRTHSAFGRIIDTTLTLLPVDPRAARSSCRALLSPAPIPCHKCALHLPDMTLFDTHVLCRVPRAGPVPVSRIRNVHRHVSSPPGSARRPWRCRILSWIQLAAEHGDLSSCPAGASLNRTS